MPSQTPGCVRSPTMGAPAENAVATPEREVEDLAAVIAAFDDDAVVIGHSSGIRRASAGSCGDRMDRGGAARRVKRSACSPAGPRSSFVLRLVRPPVEECVGEIFGITGVVEQTDQRPERRS